MKKLLRSVLIAIILISLVSCQSQVPYIGENGNWWIGDQDLGVAVRQPQDEQGGTGGYIEEDLLPVTEIAKVLRQSTVIVRGMTVYSESSGVYSSGVGFMVSENGYIATLYSIVQDCETIEIVQGDGQIINGELIAYNEAENIAFVRVDCTLPVVPIGNSSGILQGETVYAIGANDNTLIFSQGIISAENFAFSHSGSQYTFDTKTFLTDASLGDGSKCGVIANQEGKVIGLAFGVNSSIHCVLPINVIMKLVESVEATGNCNDVETGNTRMRPIIGMQVETITTYDGIIVKYVTSGSFSDGVLQNGDIIYELDGVPIGNVDQFIAKLYDYRLGQTIHLKINRLGEMLEVNLHLSTTQ